MNNSSPETLPYLSSQERLQAYQLIVDGCSHIWSKGQLQTPKALTVLQQLIPLTHSDPAFLARFNAYAMRQKTAHKDLQVFTTYANSLNSANGTPFSPGSTHMKPNLRYVAAAAVQLMDPKLASRVLEVAELRYAIQDVLNESRHFSTTLRTGLEKYLKYREANLHVLRGIKKAGMTHYLKYMYKGLRLPRSAESAAIMRWREKGKTTKFEDTIFNFKELTDLQIAEKIQKEKLSVLGVLGALPRKMSPVIAVALLEQATGNQAVILRTAFEEAGVLKDDEVMQLYEEKVKTAKTALDRVDTIAQNASNAVKEVLTKARAENRQAQTVGLGKIFLHLDDSGSMQAARAFAIENGAIFAECVNDPLHNFNWGIFGSRGQLIPLPKEFVKEAFAEALFLMRDGGGTDCFALYPNARDFGADIDVFVTDQDHTHGDLRKRIREYHAAYPEKVKPRICVIIYFAASGNGEHKVKQAYEANGIPVVELSPDTIAGSALVVQTIQQALLGPTVVIDQIMDTELLKLPTWYYAL